MKPIEVLFTFLAAILLADLKKAFGLTTKTYGQSHNPDHLKREFGTVPDQYEVLTDSIKEISPVHCSVSATLRKGDKEHTHVFHLVRESWPNRTDITGDWGVDPQSLGLKASDFKIVKHDDSDEKDEAERKRKLNELRMAAKVFGIEVADDADPDHIRKQIDFAVLAERKGLIDQVYAMVDKDELEADLEKMPVDELKSLTEDLMQKRQALVAELEDMGAELPVDKPMLNSEISVLVEALKDEKKENGPDDEKTKKDGKGDK